MACTSGAGQSIKARDNERVSLPHERNGIGKLDAVLSAYPAPFLGEHLLATSRLECLKLNVQRLAHRGDPCIAHQQLSLPSQ